MGRRAERRLSAGMIAVLTGAGLLALLLFSRELPAMRRYLRMRRM